MRSNFKATLFAIEDELSCPSVGRSVGRSVGLSVCHDFLKGREVSLLCSIGALVHFLLEISFHTAMIIL